MTPSTSRCDITSRADITDLLRDFYGRMFVDALLGPVFVDIARMDLDLHLPVIADFWEAALLRGGSYRRNMFTPHEQLHERAHLTPAHFARWLAIWETTVDDRHKGATADLAKLQGSRIARSMCRRLTGVASLPS